MAIYAREPETKFTPAPEGLHPAVCCDVVDLGMVTDQFGSRLKVEIRWMLDTLEGCETRPVIRKWYTNSLSEKANLRRDLEMWRGRKFTADELSGFDLEKLLGASCQVQVIHNVKDDGKVWANVQAIIPLGKGMAKVAIDRDYVRECDKAKAMPGGADAGAGSDDDACPF